MGLRSRLGSPLSQQLAAVVNEAILLAPSASAATSLSSAMLLRLGITEVGEAPSPSEEETAEDRGDGGVEASDAGLRSSLSELESLCTLMDAESSFLAVGMSASKLPETGEGRLSGESGSVGGVHEEEMVAARQVSDEETTSSRCGLDADLLLNKVYVTVAMAGPEVWSEPTFLTRCIFYILEVIVVGTQFQSTHSQAVSQCGI